MTFKVITFNEILKMEINCNDKIRVVRMKPYKKQQTESHSFNSIIYAELRLCSEKFLRVLTFERTECPAKRTPGRREPTMVFGGNILIRIIGVEIIASFAENVIR